MKLQEYLLIIFLNQNQSLESGMVTRAWNLSSWKTELMYSNEFKVILHYIVRYMPAWATWKNSILKKKNVFNSYWNLCINKYTIYFLLINLFIILSL